MILPQQQPKTFVRTTPKQLVMSFGDDAEQLYYDGLPFQPLVSNNVKVEGLFKARRDRAILFKTIQHNPNGMIRCIVFDIDKPFARDHWYDCNAPEPNWVIINPANGHAHYVYMLSFPVPTTDASRLKPQKYLALIERALALKMNADINYVGLVSKNPLCGHHDVIKARRDSYSLDELEEYVFIDQLPKLKKREHNGTSRHCILFDELRWWAYPRVMEAKKTMTQEQWINTLTHKAEALNTFDNALMNQSLKHTARSVGNWTWTKYSGSSRAIRRGRDMSQNSLLDTNDKQSLAAIKTAEQKKNKTQLTLQHTIQRLERDGIKITQANVAKASQLSLPTVKRYWNKL